MIKIEDKKDCMGCHGCQSICPKKCIDMEVDFEGFKYPKVNYKKCISCRRCIEVCPILTVKKIETTPVAYACYNKNQNIRNVSSSGGIFTLLAEKVLENNGIIFGAKFSKDFDVAHGYTTTLDGVSEFRGAKYVQSIIGNSYIEAKVFLEEKKQVLFSGTPCQISGLKRYLKKDYNNLITVDLICHGVPSPKAWRKYKEETSEGQKIKNIRFREKTNGWRSYSLIFSFNNGLEKRSLGKENSYIRGFIGDIYLRPSCHKCSFKGLNRESDITLADFWGIENIAKEMDDNKGTSLVFINSKFGKNIFKKIKSNIKSKEININEAIKYNLSAIKSSYKNPRREYFFRNIKKYNFDKLVQKSLRDSLEIRIKIKILKILKYLKKKYLS